MKLSADAQERIEKAFDEKKTANPLDIRHRIIGLGIELYTGFEGVDVYRNGSWVCELGEVSRMMEELTMLKESVEEQTGVIL